MKKLIILSVILFLILIILLAFLIAKPEKDLDLYTHTKAICNETNYCQDYQISCNSKGIIMSTPITGAAVQFPENWKDPRNENEKKLC